MKGLKFTIIFFIVIRMIRRNLMIHVTNPCVMWLFNLLLRFIVGQDLNVAYVITAYHHYQTWKDNIEKIKYNCIWILFYMYNRMWIIYSPWSYIVVLIVDTIWTKFWSNMNAFRFVLNQFYFVIKYNKLFHMYFWFKYFFYQNKVVSFFSRDNKIRIGVLPKNKPMI